MYYVYILRNAQDRLYIGVTDDVDRRVRDHNTGVSKWTRSRGPWTLIWHKSFPTLGEARRHENLLKRQGRGSGFYRITGLTRSGS